MKHYFYFTFLCLFLITPQSYAGKLLYIGFTDETAITAEEHQFYIRKASLYRPQSEIISVVLPASLIRETQATISAVVRQEILDLKLEDYSIDTLIITTHGNTFTENGITETTLSGLGRFSETQVSEYFKETLGTLKNKLAPKVSIVFNSCSTMMGTSQEIEKRATIFMNSLGVKDGTLYGSHTPERSTLRAQDFIYSKKGSKLVSLIPQVIYIGSQIQMDHLNLGLLSFTGAFSYFLYWQLSANQRTAGSLIEFVNGSVTNHLKIKKAEHSLLIYGFNLNPCSETLSTKF